MTYTRAEIATLADIRHALAVEIVTWRRMARRALNGRDWREVRKAVDLAGLMGETYLATMNAMLALRHFATALPRAKDVRRSA